MGRFPSERGPVAADCGPVDGFESIPGGAIPPRTRGNGPIRPGAALKKVAPAYLSRPTAAPARSRTAE